GKRSQLSNELEVIAGDQLMAYSFANVCTQSPNLVLNGEDFQERQGKVLSCLSDLLNQESHLRMLLGQVLDALFVLVGIRRSFFHLVLLSEVRHHTWCHLRERSEGAALVPARG